MNTTATIPALGASVRITEKASPHYGVAGIVTGLEPGLHYDGSPAVEATLFDGGRVWGHASTLTTETMPQAATWDDFVTAHGGPEASGWWVTIDWSKDSPPESWAEVIGPYRSESDAVDAMQDSLLIDGIAEDTHHVDTIEDITVDHSPATIASMLAAEGIRPALIDPCDPHHFGRSHRPGPEGVSTSSVGSDTASGALQASHLRGAADLTPSTSASAGHVQTLGSPARAEDTPER